MLIAIPSKSRPWKSTSKEMLTSGILFVPEYEEAIYRKIYDDVIPVPASVKGITATRNWILDQYKGEDVVFIDDDLKTAGYWQDNEKGQRRFVKIKDGAVFEREFEKLFEVCKGIGYKIWGLKTEASKISQYDEKPFLFKTYITASCMGMVNDTDLRFDESFRVKEDYEIGMRHIEKYGGVLGVRYITWENKHWDTNGGCGDYRTDQIERECINKLIARYPKYIKSVNRKNSKYCIRLMF